MGTYDNLCCTSRVCVNLLLLMKNVLYSEVDMVISLYGRFECECDIADLEMPEAVRGTFVLLVFDKQIFSRMFSQP